MPARKYAWEQIDPLLMQWGSGSMPYGQMVRIAQEHKVPYNEVRKRRIVLLDRAGRTPTRHRWSAEDRDRLSTLIRGVAQEMGITPQQVAGYASYLFFRLEREDGHGPEQDAK